MAKFPSFVSQCLEHSPVYLKGWVKHCRKLKHATFVHLTDGLTNESIQVVFTDHNQLLSRSRDVTLGSALKVNGKWVKSPAKGQTYEVLCSDFEIVGDCPVEENPIQPRHNHSPAYLRRAMHFRSRTNFLPAMLRVRQEMTNFTHQFFQRNNFLHIDTPIVTSNDCEGAGEYFVMTPNNKLLCSDTESNIHHDDDLTDQEINTSTKSILESISGSIETIKPNQFFNRKVHCTISSQLHLEALACGIGQVYTITPCFRAESSSTKQHLAEFRMIEAEIAFVQTLDDLIKIITKYCTSMAKHLLENRTNDIETCSQYHKDNTVNQIQLLHKLAGMKMFAQVTYSDAIEILLDNRHVFGHKPRFENGLNKEHERYLASYFGDVPVFITNFPSQITPFYMKQSGNSDTVDNFDLVVPGPGEIVGGSLREDNYEFLENRLKQQNLVDSMKWYLDLRRLGHAPCGGFGIGFERLLQYLAGINNIKDTIAFPRFYKHCYL